MVATGHIGTVVAGRTLLALSLAATLAFVLGCARPAKKDDATTEAFVAARDAAPLSSAKASPLSPTFPHGVGCEIPQDHPLAGRKDSGGAGGLSSLPLRARARSSPLLLGEWLYVANTDALVRFPYREGQTKITGKEEKILGLPAGGYNNHWTRNVVASPEGSKL